MNRRDFLKVGSVFSAAALAPIGNIANLDVEAAAFGKIYRSSKGKVLVSSNKGKTWQLHTQFSSGYTVQNIFVAGDKRLYIQMQHKRASFYLVLTKDGKAWSSEPFKTQPKPKA